MSTLDPTTNLPKSKEDALYKLLTSPVQTDDGLYGTGATAIDLSKWEGVDRRVGADNEEIRARNQSGWDLTKNAAIQSLGIIVGGSIEGVGYLADMFDMSEMSDRIKGEDATFDNILTQWGSSLQDYVNTEVAPIYQTRAAQEGWALGDATWWASNAPSIASTFSMMIPMFAARGVVTSVARGLNRGIKASKGGAKMMDNIADTRLLQTLNNNKAKALADHTASSVVSRHIYNSLEASDVYQTNYEELINRGMSEEEASQIAGQSAAQMYREGYWNIWKDMLMWNTLLRGTYANRAIQSGSAVRDPRLSAAIKQIREQYGEKSLPAVALSRAGVDKKEILLNAFGEGFEEFNIQFQKQRATAFADILSGISDEEAPKGFLESYFSRDLVEYAKDRKTWDATFWGFAGGLLFGAGAKMGIPGKIQDIFTKDFISTADVVQRQVAQAEYINTKKDEIIKAHVEGNVSSRDAALDELSSALTLGAIVEGNTGARVDSSIHEGRFNQQLESLQEIANTPESQITSEDIRNNVEVAKMLVPRMEQIVNLFNKNFDTINKGEYSPYIASAITEHQYLAQRARERKEEYQQELSNKKQDLPQFDSLSPTIKEAAETELEIESLEATIKEYERQKEALETAYEGKEQTKSFILYQESINEGISRIKEQVTSLKENIKDLKNTEDTIDQELYDAYKQSGKDVVSLNTQISQMDGYRQYHEKAEAYLRIPKNQDEYIERIKKSAEARKAKAEAAAAKASTTKEELDSINPETKEGVEASDAKRDAINNVEQVKSNVTVPDGLTDAEREQAEIEAILQQSADDTFDISESTLSEAGQQYKEELSGEVGKISELKRLKEEAKELKKDFINYIKKSKPTQNPEEVYSVLIATVENKSDFEIEQQINAYKPGGVIANAFVGSVGYINRSLKVLTNYYEIRKAELSALPDNDVDTLDKNTQDNEVRNGEVDPIIIDGDTTNLTVNQVVKINSKTAKATNGKIGKIVDISESGILVEFSDGKKARYKPENLLVVKESNNAVKQAPETTIKSELYKGVEVIYVDKPFSDTVHARYNRKSNKIGIYRKGLQEKFESKAWTTGREISYTDSEGKTQTMQVNALPEDTFDTYEKWETFVLEHEYQHSQFSFTDFKNEFDIDSRVQYENYINQQALKQLGYDITVFTLDKSQNTQVVKIEDSGITVATTSPSNTYGSPSYLLRFNKTSKGEIVLDKSYAQKDNPELNDANADNPILNAGDTVIFELGDSKTSYKHKNSDDRVIYVKHTKLGYIALLPAAKITDKNYNEYSELRRAIISSLEKGDSVRTTLKRSVIGTRVHDVGTKSNTNFNVVKIKDKFQNLPISVLENIFNPMGEIGFPLTFTYIKGNINSVTSPILMDMSETQRRKLVKYFQEKGLTQEEIASQFDALEAAMSDTNLKVLINNKKQFATGFSHIVVPTTNGSWKFIRLQNRKLTPQAVNRIFELLQEAPTEAVKSLIGQITPYVEARAGQEANKQFNVFISTTNGAPEFLLRFEGIINGVNHIIEGDLATFNKGEFRAIPKSSFQLDENGNVVSTEKYKKYTNQKPLEMLKTFLNNKNFTIDHVDIASDSKYVSPIDGKEYNNYLEYLSSDNTLEGHDLSTNTTGDNEDVSKAILTTNIMPVNGSVFHNTRLEYNPIYTNKKKPVVSPVNKTTPKPPKPRNVPKREPSKVIPTSEKESVPKNSINNQAKREADLLSDLDSLLESDDIKDTIEEAQNKQEGC